MNGLLNFCKTTLIGGVVVLVPTAILGFIFFQVYLVVAGVAAKVVELSPFPGLVENPYAVMLLGVICLLLICFTTGLLVRLAAGKNPLQKVSDMLANKIPMYKSMQLIIHRVTGTKGLEFTPVEVDLHGSETRTLGFIIEELPEDRVTVFVPSAPAITVGQVFVVPKSKILELDCSPTDLVNAVSQWGVESKKLYRKPVSAEPAS